MTTLSREQWVDYLKAKGISGNDTYLCYELKPEHGIRPTSGIANIVSEVISVYLSCDCITIRFSNTIYFYETWPFQSMSYTLNAPKLTFNFTYHTTSDDEPTPYTYDGFLCLHLRQFAEGKITIHASSPKQTFTVSYKILPNGPATVINDPLVIFNHIESYYRAFLTDSQESHRNFVMFT